jgi:hypothetical protein
MVVIPMFFGILFASLLSLTNIVLMPLLAIPMWILLPKYGYNKFISLVCIVPIIGSLAFLILVWIFAFSEMKQSNEAESK